MTTTADLNTQGSVHPKRHTTRRVALVVVFWAMAAVVVAIAHRRMYARSPVACVVVETSAIVALAGAYMKLTAPTANLDHALFVGTTWLILGIAVEVFMTVSSGRQWFALLGSPENGGLRCVLLIAWIIAPSLFVSYHE
jgi:hypothetical protein